MQTPIKYALGFLALIAAVAPTTSAGYATHAHGYIFATGLDSLGPANLANACDDSDIGSTLTATAYDVMVNVVGFDFNSFPATTVRAGDQGVSSACVYIFPAEHGSTFTIVANGCTIGAPVYAGCSFFWSKQAESLGIEACFYDGVDYTTPLGCADTYDYKGDLVGTIPAGSVYMLVKGCGPLDFCSPSSLVSWWMYDGYAY